MSDKLLLAATVIIILALVATMIAFMVKSQGKLTDDVVEESNPEPSAVPLPQPEMKATSSVDSSLNSAQQKEYQAILAHNSEFTQNVRRIREVSPPDAGYGAMGVVNTTCRGSLPPIKYDSTVCVTQQKDPVLGYRYDSGDLSGPLSVGAGALGRPF